MGEEEVSKKLESLAVGVGDAEQKWEPMAFPEDRLAHIRTPPSQRRDTLWTGWDKVSPGERMLSMGTWEEVL